MPKKQEEGLVESSRLAWEAAWNSLIEDTRVGTAGRPLDDAKLVEAIRLSINSKMVSHRYVLPTQVLAKYVNSDLDARCIQAQRGGDGSFDARTIAHKVIVPFDKKNLNVLGGSTEPYVNNPLRVPEVSLDPRIIGQQKDKEGWRRLYLVLNEVQERNEPEFTAAVLRQIQIEIADRLSIVKVVYPAPRRISLDKTINLLGAFLATPSGGDRAQAIATALFQTIGNKFGIYSEVRRSKTNAADTGTGQVADLECLDEEGVIILAIEIKDSRLILNHLKDKVNRVREGNVAELLFLVKEGVEEQDILPVEEIIRNEFTSGQNLYVFDLLEFSRVLLALLGEDGRREFVGGVGPVLDQYGSPLSSKQEWAGLLSKI